MRNLSYEKQFSSQVHLDANLTHFHMKGFALGLVLKQRQNAIRKWPIVRHLVRVAYLPLFVVILRLSICSGFLSISIRELFTSLHASNYRQFGLDR